MILTNILLGLIAVLIFFGFNGRYTGTRVMVREIEELREKLMDTNTILWRIEENTENGALHIDRRV
jgi:hypothetical protein